MRCVSRIPGSYEGIKGILSDVHSYLKYKKGQKADRGFSIFYNDTAAGHTDSLRCIGGGVTDSLPTNIEPPYRSMKIDSTPAVVGTFPIRTFLSYTTGSLKFSAALTGFCSHNKIARTGPVLAVYDMPARQIRYYAPILP